jgi:hypothetical protein
LSSSSSNNSVCRQAKGNKYLPEEEKFGYILSTMDSGNDLSFPILTTGLGVMASKNVIHNSIDADNILHYLIKNDVATDPSSQKYTKMHICNLCLEGGK